MKFNDFLDDSKLREIRKIISNHKLQISSSLILAAYLLSGGVSGQQSKKSGLSIPTSPSTVNSSFYSSNPTYYLDTISNTEISNEEKIAIILEKYDLTLEELNVCAAISIAEACGEGMNYAEAQNVINTAYNRIISAKWVDYLGDNLYEQMTASGQFIVYESGAYKKYLGKTDLPGYQAVIDFLSNTSKLNAHNYLSFCANSGSFNGKVELVEGGNLYFDVLTEEDRLNDIRTDKSFTLTLMKT